MLASPPSTFLAIIGASAEAVAPTRPKRNARNSILRIVLEWSAKRAPETIARPIRSGGSRDGRC